MGCFQQLLVLLGLRPPNYPELRTICVNHMPMKKGEQIVEEKYPNNRVVTSRYTIFTFLFKNLFEQFCRVANFYFLVVAIIQFIIDTPVSPATSVMPLVIVLATTAIKQAYEDFLRHRADNKVNNTPVRVVRGGSLRTIKSYEVCVGDVLRVDRNESFPCDLLLLSSSDLSGECSVTTANLDGETNLKSLMAVEATRTYQSVSAIQKRFRARIGCEQPTSDLHKFKGNMTIRMDTRDELKIPLSAKNMLLRGAVLRNTEFVFGVAIYTGQETKMQLNSQRGKTKKSVVERRLDRFLLCFMAILFFLAIFSSSMKWIYFSFDAGIHSAWYLPPEETTAWRIIQDFLGFLVLFNYLIPISLYVTIELQKFLGSMFFESDLDMYFEDPDTGEKFRAQANTSDLNEELGQVQYLFSDKTGTLTENKMTFRNCSIGSKCYCDMNGQLWLTEDGRPVKKRVRFEPDEELFFTVLALCHTIRVEVPKKFGRGGREINERLYTAEEAQTYTYQASSPDEKAFVEACRNFGIIFHGTEEGVSIISYKNVIHKYRVMEVLEFDSDRKCMSVILRRENGSYWLLTKGAESSMLDKCSSGDKESIIERSAEFARLGLRVLVIAHRQLSEDEFKTMQDALLEANQDVANREKRTVEAYKSIEQNLAAIGCTAIEDELQAGVKETITDLRSAGIQVWILTGDKRETAENISLSAGHFTESMTRIRIVEKTDIESCSQEVFRGLEEISVASIPSQYCVVVDGQSLQYLVAEDKEAEDLKWRFLELCRKTAAVLCCRCTPLQKARVVAMVKSGIKPMPVTCSIGDGANDVSMIREAHVGVGLFGKEGRAAALNSDFALARFKFLRKTLLFHGHLYYIRLAIMLQYFFYKNVAFVGAQLFYTFFSGFSAQSMYDSVFLSIYNLTMTSLPILIYGLFEQHVSRSRLNEEPELYKKIAHNRVLLWSKLLVWSGLGFWHSACCFFLFVGILLYNSTFGTYLYDIYSFGSVVVEFILICVTLRLVIFTYSFQVPFVIGIVVTVLGFAGLLSLYNYLTLPLFGNNLDFLWVYFDICQQPIVWALMPLVAAMALFPDILIRVMQDTKEMRIIRQRHLAKSRFEDLKLSAAADYGVNKQKETVLSTDHGLNSDAEKQQQQPQVILKFRVNQKANNAYHNSAFNAQEEPAPGEAGERYETSDATAG
ncbi:hypothetical protein BOX15_Mlig014307g2 [Macrostomum lignano]|uniref:Phospholipid-transporting ATPase n=1 Tax=Macrostomum lignano TaxID=282301 RepID=A0A267DDC8_9PLAT|nr:hypothetical protein BOX15_Mlig014307g2 [Macrostomum lignano]